MRAFSLQYESLSTTILADWLVSLSLSGHSLSTLQLYLNAISAISGEIDKDGSEEAGNVDFTRLRSILKEIIEEVATGESAANRKITLKSSEDSPVKPAILRALHLTAVIAGGITIESAARLRREDLAGLPESVRDITAPFEDPRRRYLFPLEQSDYTPRQLARRLASAFATAADPAIRRLPSPAEHWLRPASARTSPWWRRETAPPDPSCSPAIRTRPCPTPWASSMAVLPPPWRTPAWGSPAQPSPAAPPLPRSP